MEKICTDVISSLPYGLAWKIKEEGDESMELLFIRADRMQRWRLYYICSKKAFLRSKLLDSMQRHK